MKLNIDCVRDVLLEFETFPIGCYFVESFKKSIEHYDQEAVLYVLVKLTEADYINADYYRTEDGKIHFNDILDITFQGHEFLEKIRSDTVWNQKLKPVFLSVGSMSFDVISRVANSAITSLVLTKLGL